MLHEFKRLNQNQKGGVFKKPGFRAQNRCRWGGRRGWWRNEWWVQNRSLLLLLLRSRVAEGDAARSEPSSSIEPTSFSLFELNYFHSDAGEFRGAQKAKIDYCSLKFNRKRTHSNEWKNEESSVGVTQFISFCHSWVSLTFTSAQEKEVGSQYKVAQFLFSGPYGLPTSVAHVYGEMGSICVTRTEEPTKHKMSHTNSSKRK